MIFFLSEKVPVDFPLDKPKALGCAATIVAARVAGTVCAMKVT